MPIGPIFIDAEIASPLLDVLREAPEPDFPALTMLDEMVIYHLGEFRKRRAVSGLPRILEFDPGAISSPHGPTIRRRRTGPPP